MVQDAGTSVGPLKVFYSYSHEDHKHRRRLAEHLAQLIDERLIEDWHDDRIVPGSNFDEVIRAKLDAADLIVLLVSPPFLASEYVRVHELPRAYELERLGRSILLPILLRSIADWRRHPLFASRQSPHPGNTAVAECRSRDQAFARIAEGIRRVVEVRRGPSTAKLTDPIGPAREGSGPRAKLLGAAIECGVFSMLDENPYQGRHDRNDPAEGTRVRASLWFPARSALRGSLPDYVVAGAVCVLAQAEAGGIPQVVRADLERIIPDYRTSISSLKPEARAELAKVAGRLFSRQFLAAIAVPRVFLGDRVDDPDLAYEILLDLVARPLAAGHARLGIGRFDLVLNPIDDPTPTNQPLTGRAKRLLRSSFAWGGYGVTQRAPAGPEDLALVLARFMQWAGSRFFNDGNDDGLRTLCASFETPEGPPEGGPSS